MSRVLILLSLSLLLFVGYVNEEQFIYNVAATCKGEASFAIPECACTVSNRLEAGWAESQVLSAYYAKPQEPSSVDLWIVSTVLHEGCKQPLYFMYSKTDLRVLGIDWMTPYCYVQHEHRAVYLFEKEYRTRDIQPTGGVCGEIVEGEVG